MITDSYIYDNEYDITHNEYDITHNDEIVSDDDGGVYSECDSIYCEVDLEGQMSFDVTVNEFKYTSLKIGALKVLAKPYMTDMLKQISSVNVMCVGNRNYENFDIGVRKVEFYPSVESLRLSISPHTFNLLDINDCNIEHYDRFGLILLHLV